MQVTSRICLGPAHLCQAGASGAKESAVPESPELCIVKNARAIDPSRELDGEVDVVFENGRIVRIGPGAAHELERAEKARVIDGSGKWLLPAFVDLHAHLREPGQEYKEEIRTGLA